ncbi:D-cysteine desulfhydrase family protein [Thalassomonas actiniarum]|uniref:D-cysteine desulfhydrase family protein n=1 Tax=Thalassomonas actiniarum TaxID=485447 RepID=A0AAF0C3T0_9GAMM|nr:D-cysteine desulfhydrase family protein [Thalassomonas actiniarum]WDE01527.1 D-cysteine desulfhydrase family protein [Thalassomonas actiniarum]
MDYQQFPKVDLGFFPTPLVKLPRLSQALGCEIWMKRDDMTGLAFGGNKTRKLEYILGDALAKGCDTIITAGAAQSNHCRQTAAAAAQLNLECHLILGGEQPDKAQGNLLLDNLFGCHIHWAGENRKGEDIPALYQSLQAEGKRPYIVPYGGSNELGALAFVNAVKELAEQSRGLAFSRLIFASSSGGTHAGLMLGKRLFNQAFELIGINIDKDESADLPFDAQILELARKTAVMAGSTETFSPRELILNPNYLGEGYGIVGSRENEAIALTAQLEGILLDPVYTGRAMAGLIDMIRTGAISRGEQVLFWHTGGAPSLFAYTEQLDLTQGKNQPI